MFFCKFKDTVDGVRTLCDLKEGEKAVVRCLSRSRAAT
jgi:hypothetical protein